MEPAEDRPGNDATAFGEAMAMRLALGGDSRRWFRHRTKSRVRASAVVMSSPFARHPAEMVLAGRDDPVEAFAAKGADQPLAGGIGLGRAWWRFEDRDAEGAD